MCIQIWGMRCREVALGTGGIFLLSLEVTSFLLLFLIFYIYLLIVFVCVGGAVRGQLVGVESLLSLCGS